MKLVARKGGEMIIDDLNIDEQVKSMVYQTKSFYHLKIR